MALLATLAAGATALATSPASQASVATPPGKVVVAKNSTTTARCALTVQSVSSNTGATTVKLSAQAQPTNFSGYFTIVYSQTFCAVYDHTGASLLASYNHATNGPVNNNTSVIDTLPYDSSYIVCTLGLAKLNNGDTSNTGAVCG
ncbi:MAG TPA: hypothetical protein VKQ07_09620 [Jatrophihabitantaceae bacterium]|nr:hypothetical protein [Jatrophihabitantaceae bacterium]